jgi:hypothetical protein
MNIRKHKTIKQVERVLAALDNPQADKSKEETAIDEMVASRQLYGLTENEVRNVKGKDENRDKRQNGK